ncbi:hypothetical protein ATEIFO6365_0011035100 [Aspergillus terreus]|uniref:Uncharacterized protein n=1 Tax=Aspergillus terreus TaxID=33178 RepID=A0A5M3Z2X4_ASPTE|nr:hypothetical protein ATETN484_0006035300 [Aspergillus terreus]GFF20089.1 hypothetical protein ATEIFO6365_0011035100 [Aspergillus terreus]
MASAAVHCAPSSLRRINEGSSDSSGSSESSIYSAVRIESPANESAQKFDSGHELNSIVLDRATLARLLVSSAHTISCVSLQAPRYYPPYSIKSSRWHPYPRPGRTAFSTYTGRRLHLPPPATSISRSPNRRKVLSLNDADSRPRKSKWTAKLASPVSPVVPRYPPPVRAPTPPGVPSFGTREAMRYYAQLAHASPSDDHPSQPAAESPTATSYGAALRRFLGMSDSPPRQGGRPPVARAADGTAVLGHFPYRHSGHGLTTSRRLDDHPFHRRTLPEAPTSSERTMSGQQPAVRQDHRYYHSADADDLLLSPFVPFQSPAPIAPSKHSTAALDEPAQSWKAPWGICCCLQEQEDPVSGAHSPTRNTHASAQTGRPGDTTPDSAARGWPQSVGQLSWGIWMSLRRVASRVMASGEPMLA